MRQQMIDVRLAGGHPAWMGCTTRADAERAQIRAPRLASPPAPRSPPQSPLRPTARHQTREPHTLSRHYRRLAHSVAARG